MKNLFILPLKFCLVWIDFFLRVAISITSYINAAIQVASDIEKEDLARRRLQYIPSSHRHQGGLPMPRRLRTKPFERRPCHISKLPNEVLVMVFEILALGRKSDLSHCTLVCTQWHGLVTPILWKAPVPSHPICRHSPTSPDPLDHQLSSSSSPSSSPLSATIHVARIMDVCRHRMSRSFPVNLPKYGLSVRSICLSRLGSRITDCDVRIIVRYCDNLRDLKLSGCVNITDKSLQHISLSACAPKLRELTLKNCRNVTDNGLLSLAKSCISLEHLHLGGCVRLSNYGVTSIVRTSGNTLRRICLSDCDRLTGRSVREIAQTCSTRLEWLDIGRIGTVQHADYEVLVNSCPNLVRLNAGRAKSMFLRLLQHHRQEQRAQLHINHAALSQMNPLDDLIELLNQYDVVPDMPAYRQLLNKNDDVSNDTVKLIITHLSKLQNLDLTNWTSITDQAIQALADHGHTLTHIHLVGCEGVSKRMLGQLSELCQRNKKLTCITFNHRHIENGDPLDPSIHSGFLPCWRRRVVNEGATRRVLASRGW
ncbi:F-box and leucine-rich repeat protein 4 [Apophysomyces ossiformis]|uniref:F-box and leucine-rich repeat protein 4 n=1 Tax=Apophysomyces ossiformis TaxID=679940 RepID=A0A8H7BUF3_9FUNG|nr:F-box and leucine-rich repeat protein 4 [Apophysomyces ossiformis]